MTAKKKCKHCGEYGYDHIRVNGRSFCDREHAIAWSMAKAQVDREKAAKKAQKDVKAVHAKKKREFYDNDRSFRTKKAQFVFNSYIRLRDDKRPCISCGRQHEGQYHAGHYRSVGAHPELRFNEDNCHKQCSVCNNHLSGNLAEYRINLLLKIGLDKVEWLEGPHEAKKYTCSDLRAIELYYKNLIRDA